MKRLKFQSSIIVSIVLLTSIFFSCRKLIDVDPPRDKSSAEEVYSNRNSAIQVLVGIYASMATPGGIFTGDNSASLNGAVLSDEMDIGPNNFPNSFCYRNFLPSGDVPGYWKKLYGENIYSANSMIEGVSASKTIDEKTKSILLGEAKFLRAFSYFLLINFYGDVPLVLTTDFKVNSNIPRSSTELVYKQVVADLEDAQKNLPDDYLGIDFNSGTSERVIPNKFTVTALLAKVYLYQEKWVEAEQESSKIISNSNYELLPELNDVFLKNSRETIWQLQPNISSGSLQTDPSAQNTPDGMFLIPTFDQIPQLFASSWLLNAFEIDDQRMTKWLKPVTSGASGLKNYFIPFKYKIGQEVKPSTEYIMVFRLGEQLLIRAEARAKLGKIFGAGGAEEDLNKIRNRAGLGNTTASTPDEIFMAIAKERQTELFTEWANRWFDLKRTGKVNDVMAQVAPTKSASGQTAEWQPYKALFPIPDDQFRLNPALKGYQNPGYTERD